MACQATTWVVELVATVVAVVARATIKTGKVRNLLVDFSKVAVTASRDILSSAEESPARNFYRLRHKTDPEDRIG